MIAFDEAVRLIAAVAAPLPNETVPLDAAHGRVLAAPVVAQIASPRADVSAMDGYAVRESDLGTLPVSLTIVGQSFPGAGFTGELRPTTAVRIFTGAPVPTGADRVVMQENVRREGDRAVVQEAGSARHIRRAGSDFKAGDVLLPTGTLLTPQALVAAAGADAATLEVHRRPRLRLIATGDELTGPATAGDNPHLIPESISFGVMALARVWGADPVGRSRLRDDLPTMRSAAETALQDVDLLVVTGGASVGERDFAKTMFGDALDLIFSKVSMKPGKPVWLGRVGGVLVMGLPGNPTSALVTARLLLAPLIAGLSGRDPAAALQWRSTPLANAVGPVGDRETFGRACLEDGAARLLPNQDSGAQRTLGQAGLLVRLPPGTTGVEAGASVNLLDF